MEEKKEDKYKLGQKVELVILRETKLGVVAQINGEDEGLLYHNEIFEHLEPGQELPGYIKLIRPGGDIDLQLAAFGYAATEEFGEQILETLEREGGFMPVNDKTPPEKIYELFGMSKKKYKMSIGSLYKKRLILITDKGIELVKKSSDSGSTKK